MDRECKCPIEDFMDYETLRERVVPYNCCAPRYMCPTLDTELRRADADRTRRSYYTKRLKKQGYSEDNMPEPKKRSKGVPANFVPVDVL